MDELSGIFVRDFGLRPQGKPAPMVTSKAAAVGPRKGSYSSTSSWITERSGRHPTSTNDPFVSDRGVGISDDYVFVGASELSNPSSLDTMFDVLADSTTKTSSALPVYDRPIYDDDVFDRVPGMPSVKYEDAFPSVFSGSNHVSAPPFEDLLDNFRKQIPESKGGSDGRSLEEEEKNISEFDELIPGFGSSSSLKDREAPEAIHPKPNVSAAEPTANKAEDPFAVFSSSDLSSDPLENIGRPINSMSMHSSSKRVFADSNAFDGISNSVTSSAEEMDQSRKKSFSDDFQTKNSSYDELGKESLHHSSIFVFDDSMSHGRNTTGNQSPTFYEHAETRDDIWLTVSEVPLLTQPTNAPPPSRLPPPLVDVKANDNERLQQFTNKSSIKSVPLDDLEDFAMSKSKAHVMHNEDIFNSEKLNKKFPAAAAMEDGGEAKFKLDEEVRKREYDSIFRNNEYVPQERNEKLNFEGKNLEDLEGAERLEQERLLKEREDREEANRLQNEREDEIKKEIEKARQIAERAMREARDRAAAEARQKADRAVAEARRRAERAAVQRAAAEARERAAALARDRAEKATAEAREKAAIEAREKAALDARERAAAYAREKAAAEAREKANAARERAAVERAAAEAREKAREKAALDARERDAAEARERAEKAAAEAREKENAARERAAVERAAAEAREKAREKAALDARERAATEARERAEQANVESREKANAARERASVERAAAEARQRAQRAAVERATAEARERAAAAAREKAAAAAAAAREEQKKEENDLESIFGMGSRASSAETKRATSSETMFEVKVQSTKSADGSRRTSSSSSSTSRKAPSNANIVDDLSSIFGVPASSGEFQDIEGESEERRRARLERHQRTQERAAKALAEKNERDLQVLREQAERHRISESLDMEIKRWAAGKEGNLRALLSTLHYVLWPECGWQPVSLTDLIIGAAVKKAYRKATLSIHPDKVQQKGATLQQKYIAEKVFDLLKEAWNKFNSEELF
ncbi:auxilin-related protein 2-like [Zingiber officinale]|uniref:auxilin-related protein 2-like n=1 Tax=Zingiber officinale TaxID=94328 RepID=UPI001C4AF0D1|nr:auxilin-related protein 2-like [Zingiber officinale]